MRETEKARRELPALWYENEEGVRWIPPPFFPTDACFAVPPGFHYQRSRFPQSIEDTILGVEDGRSRVVARGSTTWNGALVLALSRPTFLERLRATLRYGWPGPRLELGQAILHAAVSCERCMNLLAHRVGCSWGYRAESKDDRSHTCCERCKPEGR